MRIWETERQRDREREREREGGKERCAKKKNIEIKKSDSGNVELSGCRRTLVLAEMSHESIC
jgi:hypothetical protein